MTLRERFWSKVDIRGPDECWPWTAGLFDDGYGKFKMGGKSCRAHRLALGFWLGLPLASNVLSLHTCDRRPCCNVFHLYPGTQLNNVRDMDRRNRRSPERTEWMAQILVEQIGDEISLLPRRDSGRLLPGRRKLILNRYGISIPQFYRIASSC